MIMHAREIEIQELKKLMKQEKDRRMYERYQTLYLHLIGKDIKQIMEITGRSHQTIRNYIKSYQLNGLEGLKIRFSPGAPHRLTMEQQEQFKQTIITSVPNDVGFTAKYNWTLELAAEYIKQQFDKIYTIGGMSKLMHRLGLSFTKPTYTLAAADEAKQKEFTETNFPELKKN